MSLTFETIVHEISDLVSLEGICVGYEAGSWRSDALASHAIRSLPDFCLKYSEYQDIDYTNAMKYVAKAARSVYLTDKFAKRGEFGELLLHVILKDLFSTIPAVSKIFFKDAPNDPVKGFDAVHVITTEEHLELWLGEVKFYKSISSAIKDVAEELEAHFKRDYLKAEFVAISNKIDDTWPHAERLKQLLDPDCSLDKVFDRICVPVLLTYESKTTQSFSQLSDAYVAKLSEELKANYESFKLKNPLKDMVVRLILLPMSNKEKLVSKLQSKLEAAQCL